MHPTRLLPVLFILAACTPKPTVAPTAVVEGFYAALLSHPIAGAPSEAELAEIAPFLGDSLKARLTAARVLRDHDVATSPGEKPAFADGDLFTSLSEGPTSFYVLATERGRVVKVPVRFERRDASHSTQWVDTAYVVPRDTSWVIEDVAFGGSWDFAAKGTLQQRLLQ